MKFGLYIISIIFFLISCQLIQPGSDDQSSIKAALANSQIIDTLHHPDAIGYPALQAYIASHPQAGDRTLSVCKEQVNGYSQQITTDIDIEKLTLQLAREIQKNFTAYHSCFYSMFYQLFHYLHNNHDLLQDIHARFLTESKTLLIFSIAMDRERTRRRSQPLYQNFHRQSYQRISAEYFGRLVE